MLPEKLELPFPAHSGICKNKTKKGLLGCGLTNEAAANVLNCPSVDIDVHS